MASLGPSSDSEQYSSGSGRYRQPPRDSRRRRSEHARPLSTKVEHLAATLQDTNQNLRAVDKMLGDYRDLGDRKSMHVDKLRDDLHRTSGRLKEERTRQSLRDSGRSLRPSDLEDVGGKERRHRTPTSPLREYDRRASDYDVYTDDPDLARGRNARNAVRFFDDMDAGGRLHELHRSVRDLSSGQLRLQDDLDREITNRNRLGGADKQVFTQLREEIHKPVIESAMSNVDKRLQSIQDELRTERSALKKKQDEVGVMSAELKQALEQQKKQAPQIEEITSLRSQLAQSEAQRASVVAELESVRRHLEQSEGGRDTFQRQVAELRRQLADSDEDKLRIQSRLEQQERDPNANSQQRVRETPDWQRQRLEEEVQGLRAQLSKSASVLGSAAELRSELDRSERQREQLSDHIEVLNKDKEQKERQAAKAITQLQEMTERHEEGQRQKRHLLVQLEDALTKLKESTHCAENYSADLQETQKQLQESESRKEEIKARAQETVRQWKLKSKKLERDADRHQHSAQTATARHEQLITDLEQSRGHQAAMAHQLEPLKRELSELLAIRASQDEQVRLKDIEVNELKANRMDLEKDLRDCKMVIERLEFELHGAKEKVMSILEDKNKIEDHVTAVETANHLAQNQLLHLQREVRENSLVKVELSAQMAELAGERQDLRSSLSESRKAEAAAREEVDTLLKRMNEEKMMYVSQVELMKGQTDHFKMYESQKIHDLTRHYKKERAEYEAELQAIKIELQEERAAGKLSKKQSEKWKGEVDRLSNELAITQSESVTLQQKYHMTREEFISKSQLTEDGLSRAKDIELALLDEKDKLRRARKDHENLQHSVSAEIDSLIDVAARGCLETYKALAQNAESPCESQKWLVNVRSKLAWLQSELREWRGREAALRSDMRDAALQSERDRQLLMAEIERLNHVVDHQAGDAQRDLTEKPERDLLEDENYRNQEEFHVDVEQMEEQTPVNDLQLDTSELTKETQKEREKIHERYTKLQDTMNSLRNELSEARMKSPARKNPEASILRTSDGSNGKRSNGSRRVAFDSVPAQNSPCDISGCDVISGPYKPITPPPLTLTEFRDRFENNSYNEESLA